MDAPISEWQKETEDPGEFLDSFTATSSPPRRVFVFTPKGDVIALPADATSGRLRLRVHTEVGHRCIGAAVNGRLVPLDSTLKMGRRSRSSRRKPQTPAPAGTG